MVELIGILVIPVVCVIGVWLIWKLASFRVNHAKWSIDEKSLGGGLQIRLVRPRDKPMIVGTARRSSYDDTQFYTELTRLRAQAKSDRDDLNRGL